MCPFKTMALRLVRKLEISKTVVTMPFLKISSCVSSRNLNGSAVAVTTAGLATTSSFCAAST